MLRESSHPIEISKLDKKVAVMAKAWLGVIHEGCNICCNFNEKQSQIPNGTPLHWQLNLMLIVLINDISLYNLRGPACPFLVPNTVFP